MRHYPYENQSDDSPIYLLRVSRPHCPPARRLETPPKSSLEAG